MANCASIFISYSHQDEAWKDYVVSHLKVGEKHGPLRVWDDRKIVAGEDWEAAIEAELARADIAVLLVSRFSLTSDFILRKEVEEMLRRREKDGLTIYPIVMSDCTWRSVDWLRAMNLRPKDGQALESFEEADQNRIMVAIVEEIMAITPPNPVIQDNAAGDLERALLASLRALRDAARKASANHNPAAEALAISLSYCLEDMTACGCNAKLLVRLQNNLGNRFLDIEEDVLGHYFQEQPVADVLAKLDELSGITRTPGTRVSTLNHRDLVNEILAEIETTLVRIRTSNLKIDQAEIADQELRVLRWEISASFYDAATVSDCRAKLEAVRVKLLERATLLTEALLAKGFPKMPTGTVFRYVPERWCPQMVRVPAGRFLMGSPASEQERYEDESQHGDVKISRTFGLGRYAITFDEYDHFCNVTMREPPDDRGWGRGSHPVINVSHDDAASYCTWLGEATGCLFQLPTEAQWEYACRAGTRTPFSFGANVTTDQVNYDGSYPYSGCSKGRYRGQTVPVGLHSPNAWGLGEMHGNVWEWCADWYGDYLPGAKTNPLGPTSGTNRVVRGGAWDGDAGSARSACRYKIEPGDLFTFLGFRVACVQGA